MTSESSPEISPIVLRVLAQAVGVDEDKVPTDAAIGVWEPWDSLAHMRIVLALEEELGKSLPLVEIVELTTLQQVSDLFRKSQQ